jgi:hypothetical protein
VSTDEDLNAIKINIAGIAARDFPQKLGGFASEVTVEVRVEAVES